MLKMWHHFVTAVGDDESVKIEYLISLGEASNVKREINWTDDDKHGITNMFHRSIRLH